MPAVIHPNDEKIWKYLVEHKTPVTQEKIAKYFIISQSKASKALNSFVDQGVVDVIKIGKIKYYKIKE